MSLNPKLNMEKFFNSRVGLLALFILSGCAGPLALDYKPTEEPPFKLERPATIHIVPFIDLREVDDPRMAGTIDAVVYDIRGNRLMLTEEVSTVVTNAIKKDFTAAGFIVTTGPEAEVKDADLVLTGEVKRFRLHIGSRDEVEIELSSRITDVETKKVLWSGVTGENIQIPFALN
jgi:uncharacterized lipoprotein YajG